MGQIDVLGSSVEHHNADVTKEHFSPVLWTFLNKFYVFPYKFLPTYLYVYL